jgi:hypothetical protein
MIVACLVPVLCLGGCWGSGFESEGMHDMATDVRIEEGLGIALLVTGGVLLVSAPEAEGLAAFKDAFLGGMSMAIGTGVMVRAEMRYGGHVRRRQTLEVIEDLRAEHPEVLEALGPPEELQHYRPARLQRLAAMERLRVEDPERFRRLRKELIAGWACLGGSALVLPILVNTFPEENTDWTSSQWAAYTAEICAMTGGLLILTHYAITTRSASSLGRGGSARFILAPNGCAVSFRF